MQEDFFWRAYYRSQDVEVETEPEFFDEHDEQGIARGFGLVDIPRVHAIELIPQQPHLRGGLVTIPDDGNTRPIFFRRRSIQMDMDGDELGRQTITCLGWQKTVEGHNVASYTFFFSDGSVLVTDDCNAV